MSIRKSIAILTVITALFAGACEMEEDPGTDVGNTEQTDASPGGNTSQNDTGGY